MSSMFTFLSSDSDSENNYTNNDDGDGPPEAITGKLMYRNLVEFIGGLTENS